MVALQAFTAAPVRGPIIMPAPWRKKISVVAIHVPQEAVIGNVVYLVVGVMVLATLVHVIGMCPKVAQ